MAAVRILVDTDIFIDYLNQGRYAGILGDPHHRIYYSVVTERELLTKPGLADSERRAIHDTLRRFRRVSVSRAIAGRYSSVRSQSPALEREDALIAATSLEKRLPLFTRNWRHFRQVPGLSFYTGP